MNKFILFCTSFILLVSVKAGAQDSFSVRAQRYIEKYYSLAMAEQVRSGVPASVTLAQGVLETEAGRSELACAANNHFGIKCKSDYQGEKFFHDDDAPKECFKMYRCAEDSYKDHSDYLKRNPRYNPLFSLSQTDYAAWAVCLKKCGYATNPQYAQRLIRIIEDFKLQQYTYAAMDSTLLARPLTVKKETIAAAPINTTVTGDTPSTGPIVITTPFATDGKPAVKKGGRPAASQRPAYTAQQPVAEEPKPVAAEPKQETPVQEAKPAIAVQAPVATGDGAAEEKKVNGAVAVASLNEKNANVDGKHNIQVNDGPLPVQEAPNQEPQEIKQVQPTADTKYDSGRVITINGLKAFYAYKGEMLLQYAVKYNIRYQHLLEINELPDAPLEMNMPVYLEKKLSSGTHARHTVKEGETMYMIAQMEGIQLKRLHALNMMDFGEEPATGVLLELQNGVYKKPTLRAVPQAEARGNMSTLLGKSTPPADMIAIDRKPAAPQPTAADTAIQQKARTYVETMAVKPLAKDNETPVAAAQPIQESTARPEPVAAKPVATATSSPAGNTASPAKDTAHVVNTANQLPADSVIDDLAALKAELDKVVYTDDRQVTQAAAKQVKPVKHEEKIIDTPKKVKKKANDDDDDDDDKKKKGGNYYTIKEGETLGGIANRHNTTVKKLMQLNHISATQIRAGRKLRIK